MNVERRLERMQKELGLTPDQSAQIKGIFDEGKGKMEELRANTALSQEDRRSKMMEMREHENAKIKAVLTPEQKVKYEAMEAKMRERMRDRGEGGGAPPPPPPPQ
jgi:Spy/CpxP family protein refolding chaperone